MAITFHLRGEGTEMVMGHTELSTNTFPVVSAVRGFEAITLDCEARRPFFIKQVATTGVDEDGVPQKLWARYLGFATRNPDWAH